MTYGRGTHRQEARPRAGCNANRLRLAWRQGDPARRIADHAKRRLFLVVCLGAIDIVELAVGAHTAQLQPDAIGRFFRPDIAQDHFCTAAAIEDDARRSDEKVALGSSGNDREE